MLYDNVELNLEDQRLLRKFQQEIFSPAEERFSSSTHCFFSATEASAMTASRICCGFCDRHESNVSIV